MSIVDEVYVSRVYEWYEVSMVYCKVSIMCINEWYMVCPWCMSGV